MLNRALIFDFHHMALSLHNRLILEFEQSLVTPLLKGLAMSRGLQRFTASVLSLIAVLSNAQAVELDWLERYALSNNRESILRELIPGTEDYYRFHTLHYQTIGQLDLAQAMLDRWERDASASHNPYLVAFRDRQMLIAFSKQPDRTFEYLKARLNIELHHAPPPSSQDRRFPDTIDQTNFNYESLIKQAIRDNATLSQQALQYVGDKVLASPEKKYEGVNARWVLDRLTNFAYPNLSALVNVDLQGLAPHLRSFGELEAHRQLTLAQLHQLRKDVPEVANSEALIHEILTRMKPPAQIDLQSERIQRKDYFQRVYDFVATLPDAFNSLKAHALYRLLETNVALDLYDEQLFLAYLKLPRNSYIIAERLIETTAGQNAQLERDFSSLIRSPGIQDEQPLVRVYLERLLKDAKDTSKFKGLLKDDYLVKVFAEAKLLSGEQNAEEFYRMMSPAEQRALKERVELTLTSLNREHSNVDELASLSLDVKAVNRLIVRTYKINTSAYYRTRSEIVNSDIDLDGLVPSQETTIEFNQDSVIRHRENINLPGIEGRGVWVIDLLGNGLRCRALIRRGDLDAVVNTHDSGILMTILNEKQQRVSDATIRVGANEFKTDVEGRALIPFVDVSKDETAIVSDGKVACPVQFRHASEQYSLTSSMLIHREALLPGQTSELIIRPQLKNSDQDISLTRIDNATVTVIAKTSGGIETKRRFEKIKFSDDLDTVVEFRVPEDCRELTAMLEAEIVQRSNNQRITLTTSQSWPVATFEDTHNLNDVFLTRSKNDWVFEVRGRNGEAIKGVPIQFSFQNKVSNTNLSAVAQTNELGQIKLTSNPVLTSVTAVSGNQSRTWTFDRETATMPFALYATVDDLLRIPVVDTPALGSNDDAKSSVQRFVLVEYRSEKQALDLSSQLELNSGFLTLGKLSIGTYVLDDRATGRRCTISISAGKIVDGFTVGASLQTPVELSQPFTISDIKVDGKKLVINVPGAGKFTRVHVFASRYLPAQPLSNSLERSLSPKHRRSRFVPPNVYISGLKLGEEYQYVLRRQSAKKYPGVLLPQPSLLLNPWVIDTAENELQYAQAGDAPAPAPMGDVRSEKAQEANGQNGAPNDNNYSSFDYLKRPALILSNLEVVDGRIEATLDDIEAYPIITAIAVDPHQLVQRQIYQQLPTIESRDLRLQESFKPDLNLAQRRSIRIADREHPIAVADLGMGELQIYRTLGELFPVFGNLNKDSRWSEFNSLASWHTYDEQQKLDIYAKIACHEVHLFLWAKDRGFFDKVIQPYLLNKKEKQFIDDFLLGRNLSKYTELWRYNQLNAAEKALLAQALPSSRDAIIRELVELAKLRKLDPATERMLVESAIEGKAIELEDLALSLNGAMHADRLSEFTERFDQPMLENESRFGAGYGGGIAAAPKIEAGVEALRRQRSLGKMDAKDKQNNYYFDSNYADFAQLPQLFQNLDQTKQWAESQWDRVRGINDTSSLISANQFWRDLAQTSSLKGFHSKHLLEAIDSRHASLVALALVDLALINEFELPSEKDATLAPEKPIVIASREIVRLEQVDESKQIMVGQSVVRADAASDQEESSDKVQNDAPEYLVNMAYEAKITLTNLSRSKKSVDVLWQIPQGAIAIPSHTTGKVSLATDSTTVDVEAFSTTTVSYAFYFPAAGKFVQYPVSISREDRVLARGERIEYNVVAEATQFDEKSWEFIAARGSAEQIEAFLKETNLRKINWSHIYHRLQDPNVYSVVVKAVDTNLISEPTVFGYSLWHKDKATLGKLLSVRPDFTNTLGPNFDSELVTIEPVSRKFMEHLEFTPLVVPRIHSLREKLELTNAKLEIQYTSLLESIAYANQLDNASQLAVIYYQLVNNRIDEAISRFRKLKPESIDSKLQYDYLDAYLSLHQADVERATQIAERYRSYPVPRWASRFNDLQNQIRDIKSLQSERQLVNNKNSEPGVDPNAGDLALIDREQRQEQYAAQQPSISLKLEGDRVKIEHSNTNQAIIKLYAVDLEMLFSKTPFVRDGLERMAIAEPTVIEELSLDANAGTTIVQVPEKYRNQTVLIEVESGASRDTELYYGGRLATYIAESYGQLQVMQNETRQPVPGAYVKVYAKHQDGTIRFYKDGYTDLRGRFDYVSISNNDLLTTERLAILVLDPENGATLHDVKKP